MNTHFAGGKIFKTDYFTSRAREEGKAWLTLEGTTWHVLLPRLCQPIPTVACGTGKLFCKLNHFLTGLSPVQLR